MGQRSKFKQNEREKKISEEWELERYKIAKSYFSKKLVNFANM